MSKAPSAVEPDEAVHVWRVFLDVEAATIHRLRGLLNADERNRADRFHFEKDRKRFTVARGRLRQILGGYLNQDPETLDFSYNEYGKPFLKTKDTRPFFNVSHSRAMALIAVSNQFEIGIDIEFKEKRDATFKIAHRFFSQTEVQELMNLPEQDRLQGFFNCWTRKEAYIKAKGKGLAIPLGSFGITLTPGVPVRLIFDKNDERASEHWSFSELFPDPGYAAALAVRHSHHTAECLEYVDFF